MHELTAEHRSRVVAVVSSFHPKRALIDHCSRIQAQVAQVIVVDDGSGASADDVLNQLETLGADVMRLAENAGIGHAMNTGVAAAREYQPEFVVTFDQDSEVPAGFVAALVREYDRVSALGYNIGLVAPEYYSATSQALPAETGDYLSSQAPIQSGTLIPIRVFTDLGKQREDFFIDLVDTEYAYRAKQHDYVIVCAPGIALPHTLGHKLYVHAFGKRLLKSDGRPRMVAVSSPFRYYYRARNRILFNRAYRGYKQFRNALLHQALNDLLLDFSVAVYSSTHRWRMLRLLLAGWRDGLFNRTGKIPPKTEKLAQGVTWRNPAD